MNHKLKKGDMAATKVFENSDIKQENEEISEPVLNRSRWIMLNVGGVLFRTTKMTLSKDPNSFLFRLCQENTGLDTDKDENGAILIDRDPTYFVPILNYLRHGKLVLDKFMSEEGVLEEAEFYNISEVVTLMKDKINSRRRPNDDLAKKRVYRVLQCQEEELTHVISTMSDGWKFEQFTSVNSLGSSGGSNSNNSSNSSKTEFLCVVSRDSNLPIDSYRDEGFTDRRRQLQERALRC